MGIRFYGGGGGAPGPGGDHSLLINLDYASAGHLGFADAAHGVTGGDTHDHTGGHGAQIDHLTLSNIGLNTHPAIDNHIADVALHSGAKVVSAIRMTTNANQGGSPPVDPDSGDTAVVNNWGVGHADGDIKEWHAGAGVWVIVIANAGGVPPDGTCVAVKHNDCGGSFVGHENNIALCTGGVWGFTLPVDGMLLDVKGELSRYENWIFMYDGSVFRWVLTNYSHEETEDAIFTYVGGNIDHIDITTESKVAVISCFYLPNTNIDRIETLADARKKVVQFVYDGGGNIVSTETAWFDV